MRFADFQFADPFWLLALLILPLLVWIRGRRGAPALVIPFAAAWHRASLMPTSRWPAGLAGSGLILLIVALARPQIVEDKREVKQQGYDLMLSIDLSGSMLAEDYERRGESINRLQALKPVIQAFINQRTSDRIGLVVFSGRAYTLAPLTFDHDWLGRQIERLKIGMIEDGTAIGDGLGVALTRLEQAGREAGNQRKGAFVVLLTDGANNRGLLTPEQSTAIAKSRGIPVYTIGVGREGFARFPVHDEQTGRLLGYSRRLSDLDEGTLIQIANETGAKFFRAADSDTIERTFAAIDKAQKIEFQAKSYLLTTELFVWFAAPGAILLFLGALTALPPAFLSIGNTFTGDTRASGAVPRTVVSAPNHYWVIMIIVIIALNIGLGYFKGLNKSDTVSYAIGSSIGMILQPFVITQVFRFDPRLRSRSAQTKIFFWVSLFYFCMNSLSLALR